MNFFKVKTATLLVFLFGALNSISVFATDTAHGDHGDGHAKKHFFGAFIGAFDGEETDLALGIEYEFKFNSHWGIGALYEDVKDAHHGDGISSTIGSLYFHPKGAWRLGLGFGKEKVGGDHAHTENLVRVGVSYNFHVGEFGIEPSLNFDRVDGEISKVYGVALVWSF
ncbi:MAG: hypothetical protein O7F71_18990 [Gammaproteobacteria bacterium]|nr:hypothetical protein [Gammaproteobacteria bacterium]